MTNTNPESNIENTDSQSIPSDLTRRRFLIGAAATTAALGTGLVSGASTTYAQEEEAPQSQEFEGKTAFITGGARGIGLAVAEILAQSGSNIVLYDIASQPENVPYPLATEQDLANAKATIEGYGVQCLAVKGDVRDGDLLKEIANQTVSDFGSLDFMFANAGITQVGTLDSFSSDELDLVMDINLGGVMKTIQAAIPIMREQNSGRIILTASITGRMGSPFFPVYSATKWGVIGLAKSTALQMGSHNVTCNAIAPSFVRTGLLDNDYIINAMSPNNPTWDALSDSVREALHAMPVGGFDAVHVANTVRFLCSDAASLISGDVFDISAGANANFTA